MTMKKLRNTVVFVMLAVLCSSCLYSRLLTFKNQLASFDQHVVLADDGNALLFLDPVLRPGDITALSGIPPSRTVTTAGDLLVHSYTYRNLAVSPTGTPCSLTFAMDYASSGLVSFRYPAVISEVMGTNFVVSSARAIGQASIIQKEFKLDWATQSTNLQALNIPALGKVLQVLGPPLSMSNTVEGPMTCYAFGLEGPDGAARTNIITTASFTFDPRNTLFRKGILNMGRLKLQVELPALP